MRGVNKIRMLKYLFKPELRIPLILILPNKSNKKSEVGILLKSTPLLSIDFNEIEGNVLENWVTKISLDKPPAILFKNIDKMPNNKEKDYWESIITIGLKGEEYPIQLETKDGYYKTFNLPFDRIKLITTCSQYPEFLKDKGTLGYILDFSKLDSDE